MGLYDYKSVDKLVEKYINKGGYVDVINDGCLLDYGLAVCHGDGLKTCIIQEQYLNEWSSAYKIRFYNKMPKKYEKMINFY